MCEKRFPTFSFGQRSTDPSIIRGSSVITRSKSRKRKIVFLATTKQSKQADLFPTQSRQRKEGRKGKKRNKKRNIINERNENNKNKKGRPLGCTWKECRRNKAGIQHLSILNRCFRWRCYCQILRRWLRDHWRRFNVRWLWALGKQWFKLNVLLLYTSYCP